MSEDLARVPAETRRLVGAIWAERARTELGAGSGFSQVLVGLYRIGAAPEVLLLASSAARQEIEHAIGCRQLAELYLGAPVRMPRPRQVAVPAHPPATSVLRATLHLVGLSCINEALAVDFVARNLDCSDYEPVREANSTHLRDEIGHARIGWAHLGSGVLDDRERSCLADWMPRLITANAKAWLNRLGVLPERGLPGHGYASVADHRAGALTTLREVVVAGLAHVGIDATAADRAVRALG